MIFTTIDIIYNPNSTGPSDEYAKDLSSKLKEQFPKTAINLRQTKYAGHAQELASEYANSSKNPLIISVSGDGGYHEVVNGAINAQLSGANPICAVMAAGNANDHSRTLQDQSLFEAIKSQKIKTIDLLKIEFETKGLKQQRYAHSYIGLGLTPGVAVELNKSNLNAINEIWIAMKTFYKLRPFKIERNNKKHTLDSMLVTNIGEMAKVLTVSKNAKPNDGLFEIVQFSHTNKLKLVSRLAKATITGLEQKKQYKNYSFKTLQRMPVQLDGEIYYIDKNSQVTITAKHKILRTVY